MFRSRRFLAAFVAASILAAAAWIRFGPVPQDLLTGPADRSTVVLDRHGSPLYEARSSGGTRSTRLDAADLPPVLVNATIAAEDHRFFGHPGIDPLAFTRALVRNLRAGAIVEGGSTITQQTAKILLDRRLGRRSLGEGDSPKRRSRGLVSKFQEAVLALRLEHRLAKPEILALYLNVAPYGNQVVGAGRASEVYFGVQPSLLTVAQATFLAALPQRPTAYNPYKDPAPALRRQRRIIDVLVHGKVISPDEAHTARNERLQIQPAARAFAAPHFVEMVLAAHGSDRPARLTTTLDAALQSTVVDIVRAERQALRRHGAHNVAVVVLDNASSEWLAWEGSGDYFDQENGGTINGGATLRQPGSALKPFVYALGFETGETPATVLPDVPSSYPTAEPGVVYTPRNYDGTFHGPLRARQALAGSQNVPAVALASRVGVPDLIRLLRSAGFTGFDKTASHYGLGVALGNAEATLADLVGAYAVFARGGVWRRPRAVVGGIPEARTVLSPRAAFWVTDVLSDDEARAYVFGRGGSLEFPFPVAVKTGTSQAYRDNWTIGYTREVTVGVWVGNFDRRPLIGSSGVTGAAPIFHAVMLAAQRHVHGREESHADLVTRPGDLREHTVCALSGMRAGDACPIRTREWLPSGFSPLPCSWHHASEDGLLTMWPDEYRAWAAGRGLLESDAVAVVDRAPRRSVRDDARPASTRPFEIASPPHGATYLIDPTLRMDFQTLPLRALGAIGQVRWTVDGRQLGQGPGHVGLTWRLERGKHLIRARDARGQIAEAAIIVK